MLPFAALEVVVAFWAKEHSVFEARARSTSFVSLPFQSPSEAFSVAATDGTVVVVVADAATGTIAVVVFTAIIAGRGGG